MERGCTFTSVMLSCVFMISRIEDISVLDPASLKAPTIVEKADKMKDIVSVKVRYSSLICYCSVIFSLILPLRT